ncbi:redox-regulated ATPase YchF [Candidatus Sneabacter namystus]|uniref:Ribosome-binding ATPase YchF n=1 Tax=Candidatus Sneabacter namystus TaxID=2601646 RepID=A0A5C0UI82_9RICK|nr:redox-regulated ATPase YchF [Candidatus Sneabacter namystus]QEK39479.1 redox-regulated ATPase YchF [Candidatus Sneabacter namystus]
MSLKCGIVGLPNVGKSTLFNALTGSSKAEAANYPFCTIEPNSAKVPVPDIRLQQLAAHAKSDSIIPAYVEFVDIAGLVSGASKGEGLGNKFLSHIREVDAIMHVVRCFDDRSILHVSDTVDPVRDIQVIETELMLADLQSLEKQLTTWRRQAKSGDSYAQNKEKVILDLIALLEKGIKITKSDIFDVQKNVILSLNLITSKPCIYLCNIPDMCINDGNEYLRSVYAYLKERNDIPLSFSAQIEYEVSLLQSDAEKRQFLDTLGLKESGVERVARAAYSLLNLESYFTVGPQETRMWTISKGTKAPDAGGVIHSDFRDGFIKAEVISCEDYLNTGKKVNMRIEGKEYIVQDGDVIHFLFNKT